MARQARLELADMRALEEQAERENPLDGRGATPSMGLSQFRGGKKSKAKMSEAMAQGEHLARHLMSLHGAGYAEDFHKGMSGGCHTMSHARDSFNGSLMGGSQTGKYEGEGSRISHHHGEYEEYTGGGGVVGAGKTDGRKKRAEIVRKVMKSKGLKMIEASKYVKAHGLYKGGAKADSSSDSDE